MKNFTKELKNVTIYEDFKKYVATIQDSITQEIIQRSNVEILDSKTNDDTLLNQDDKVTLSNSISFEISKIEDGNWDFINQEIDRYINGFVEAFEHRGVKKISIIKHYSDPYCYKFGIFGFYGFTSYHLSDADGENSDPPSDIELKAYPVLDK